MSNNRLLVLMFYRAVYYTQIIVLFKLQLYIHNVILLLELVPVMTIKGLLDLLLGMGAYHIS